MTLGKYIAFEGLEGCGKSTHVKRLASRIGGVVTREPGGTPIGEKLRNVLIDPTNINLSPRSEALLMAADRALHMTEVVRPALNAGKHVVSDRSLYSSLAYQGYGRNQDVDELRKLNNWAVGGLWPDLVIYIETPNELLLERLKKRELDRFEQEDDQFFQRVAKGFLTMSQADPQRWVIIDGTPTKDIVEQNIFDAITQRLEI